MESVCQATNAPWGRLELRECGEVGSGRLAVDCQRKDCASLYAMGCSYLSDVKEYDRTTPV